MQVSEATIHLSNSLYNIQSHSIITERHNVPADSPHTPWLVDKAMNENLLRLSIMVDRQVVSGQGVTAVVIDYTTIDNFLAF